MCLICSIAIHRLNSSRVLSQIDVCLPLVNISHLLAFIPRSAGNSSLSSSNRSFISFLLFLSASLCDTRSSGERENEGLFSFFVAWPDSDVLLGPVRDDGTASIPGGGCCCEDSSTWIGVWSPCGASCDTPAVAEASVSSGNLNSGVRPTSTLTCGVE